MRSRKEPGLEPTWFVQPEQELPSPYIEEGVYEVVIANFRRHQGPWGPRIVLVCEIVDGIEAGQQLCRYYRATIENGIWSSSTGAKANYPREARALTGSRTASPEDMVGMIARAVVKFDASKCYSLIHRLRRADLPGT